MMMITRSRRLSNYRPPTTCSWPPRPLQRPPRCGLVMDRERSWLGHGDAVNLHLLTAEVGILVTLAAHTPL
jgi:hypothetical protein